MRLTKGHSLALVLLTVAYALALGNGRPAFAQHAKPNPDIEVLIQRAPNQICMGDSVKLKFRVRNLGNLPVFLTLVPTRYAYQSETREISIMREIVVNYHYFELPKLIELEPGKLLTETILVDSKRFGIGKDRIAGLWAFDLSIGYLSQDGMDLIREVSRHQTNVGREFAENQKSTASDKVPVQINLEPCRRST